MLVASAESISTAWLVFAGLLVTALIAPTWLSWWNSRVAKKELKPNGGSSMKDHTTFTAVEIGMLRGEFKAHILDDAKMWTEIQSKLADLHGGTTAQVFTSPTPAAVPVGAEHLFPTSDLPVGSQPTG